MPALITPDQARSHLRISDGGSPEDADLELKMEQATSIVLNYIERPDDPDWSDEIASWTVATVPRPVHAAILVQLGELWRFRGDDTTADAPKNQHGFLSPQVERYLTRYRDMPVA